MKYLLCMLLGCGLFGTARRPATSPRPVSARAAILATAHAEVGVVEVGENRGRRVGEYQTAAGISPGDPWCAAFVFWCGRAALGAENPYPRTGWSPTMLAGGTRSTSGLLPADLFGVYFPSKGRVAHVGIVVRTTSRAIYTVEGNTSPDAASGTAADRNGGAVCAKIRPLSSNLRYKAWLTD